MSLDAFANICCCPCSCGVPPNLRSAYIVAWPGMRYRYGRTALPISAQCTPQLCESNEFEVVVEIRGLEPAILQRSAASVTEYLTQPFRVGVTGSIVRTCSRQGAINPPSGSETVVSKFRAVTEAQIRVLAVGCASGFRCTMPPVAECFWVHRLSVANFEMGEGPIFQEPLLCGNGGCDGPGVTEIDTEGTRLHGGDGGLYWSTPYVPLDQVSPILAGNGAITAAILDGLVSLDPCRISPTLGHFSPHAYEYSPNQPEILQSGDYNQTRCQNPVVGTPVFQDVFGYCSNISEEYGPAACPERGTIFSELEAPIYLLL